MPNFKKWFGSYGFPAIIAVILLALLPPILTPYMGILGTYTSYVVTGVVVVVSLFVSNRTKKYVNVE